MRWFNLTHTHTRARLSQWTEIESVVDKFHCSRYLSGEKRETILFDGMVLDACVVVTGDGWVC